MFQNKVAVVTGGAQGIGKCICEEFEKAGAKVAVIDLQENSYFVGDIADEATLVHFAEKVAADFGHVDYLINNAKPDMIGIDEASFSQFEYALRVGVTAPFYLTKLLLPYFAPGAAIVNLASSRAFMSQPQSESYSAAKGGIAALTHALAVSLAGRVRVNSIAPGWIDTPMFHKATDTDPQRLNKILGRIPAKSVGDPMDIGMCAAFLCSDAARYISGACIPVDGGALIGF